MRCTNTSVRLGSLAMIVLCSLWGTNAGWTKCFLIEYMHEFDTWGNNSKRARSATFCWQSPTSCVCLHLKVVLLLLFATCNEQWGIICVVCWHQCIVLVLWSRQCTVLVLWSVTSLYCVCAVLTTLCCDCAVLTSVYCACVVLTSVHCVYAELTSLYCACAVVTSLYCVCAVLTSACRFARELWSIFSLSLEWIFTQLTFPYTKTKFGVRSAV